MGDKTKTPHGANLHHAHDHDVAPANAALRRADRRTAVRGACRVMTNLLARFWSTTRFESAELDAYAQNIMLVETRNGLLTLSLLAVAMLGVTAACVAVLGLDGSYIRTYAVLALLSFHIY